MKVVSSVLAARLSSSELHQRRHLFVCGYFLFFALQLLAGLFIFRFTPCMRNSITLAILKDYIYYRFILLGKYIHIRSRTQRRPFTLINTGNNVRIFSFLPFGFVDIDI